jgi:hypothetical protein
MSPVSHEFKIVIVDEFPTRLNEVVTALVLSSLGILLFHNRTFRRYSLSFRMVFSTVFCCRLKKREEVMIEEKRRKQGAPLL